MARWIVPLLFLTSLSGCASMHSTPWQLMLSHDRDGEVTGGHIDQLISAVRSGCQLQVAWGARRRSDPQSTIEHIASPLWVSVRNGQSVEAQLEGFMSNLAVLGEPNEEQPRYERFGGTEKAVWWRANLKTDGSFDAVWYHHDGRLAERVPQRHPMRWYADCKPSHTEPLFPR